MLLKPKHSTTFLSFLFIFACMSFSSQAQEQKVEPKSEEVQEVEIAEIIEVSPDEELTMIPFHVVDNVPYPSECANFKTNKDKKKCTTDFIQKHAMRKFNSGLGEELGLPSGKQRILVQFKISASGKVIEARGRAPHDDLAREAERVVQLLPEFTPAKHQGENVVVAYTLPIVLYIPKAEKKGEKSKN